MQLESITLFDSNYIYHHLIKNDFRVTREETLWKTLKNFFDNDLKIRLIIQNNFSGWFIGTKCSILTMTGPFWKYVLS